MRTMLFLGALAAAGWMFSGCSGPGDSPSEVSTYQCSSCKETVKWSYGFPKRTKGKTVVHSCPSCKKVWGADLTVGTTCDVCKEKHLECPVCQKHG